MTLERIREKLEAVRASGKSCFGSHAHGFQLGPVASPDELAAFERERGWTLPETFRDFVATLGASGAGPFYGLLPLSEWETGLYHRDKLDGAALTLVDQGCGNYGLLMRTGERRGHVVYLSDTGNVYWPKPADFVSWYERWLDEILWDYHVVWFGIGMPGRESDFLAALRDADVDRRVEGAAAMFRLPSLSAIARDALVNAVETDVPAVRVNAIATLARLEITALEPLLPALLHHDDAGVRLEAMKNLAATRHAGLAAAFATSADLPMARLALSSPDVAEETLGALLDGPLWEEAMMQLRNRRGPSVVPKLIGMVEDAVFERRRAALVCLRLRKEASARDALLARFDREPELALRQEIVEGLGTIGDVDSALRFAAHEEPGVRFRAAYVLGRLGDVRAVPLLEAMTEDATKPPGAAWSLGEQARRALATLRAK